MRLKPVPDCFLCYRAEYGADRAPWFYRSVGLGLLWRKMLQDVSGRAVEMYQKIAMSIYENFTRWTLFASWSHQVWVRQWRGRLVITNEMGVAGFEEEAERKRGRLSLCKLFHDMERLDREKPMHDPGYVRRDCARLDSATEHSETSSYFSEALETFSPPLLLHMLLWRKADTWPWIPSQGKIWVP
jgi:hypothetical protein